MASFAVPAPVRNPTHGFATKFFYGVGSVAFGVKDNGFSVLLLLFYNQALGLDARLAGLAIAIALFVDAVIDPMIGYASDHLDTRWGRRRTWRDAAVPSAGRDGRPGCRAWGRCPQPRPARSR